MNFVSKIGDFLKHGRKIGIAIGALTAALLAAADYWEKNFSPKDAAQDETDTN